MYTYEKPIAELIDFSMDLIMSGDVDGKFSGTEEGNEPL